MVSVRNPLISLNVKEQRLDHHPVASLYVRDFTGWSSSLCRQSISIHYVKISCHGLRAYPLRRDKHPSREIYDTSLLKMPNQNKFILSINQSSHFWYIYLFVYLHSSTSTYDCSLSDNLPIINVLRYINHVLSVYLYQHIIRRECCDHK